MGRAEFEQWMNRIDWTNYYQTDDPNTLSEFLCENITYAIELAFPLKNIKKKTGKPKWYTEDLKIMREDEEKEHLKENKAQALKRALERERKKLRKAKKIAEGTWLEKKDSTSERGKSTFEGEKSTSSQEGICAKSNSVKTVRKQRRKLSGGQLRTLRNDQIRKGRKDDFRFEKNLPYDYLNPLPTRKAIELARNFMAGGSQPVNLGKYTNDIGL
ncbi:hypothetical protein JTB14_009416 [Gonioctena quinquepunctata]|nr:hypothetical protein JTB14_009416 [Gonioctena quinquepunctata]